ncbi:hypothetical protein HDG37_002109 [Paraburkholderia sp. MM5384-R2]|nr:hypothetical protein [Paraburkholderia sp. MM5384-R2]
MIAMISGVRSLISCSLKCGFTASHTVSGTRVCATSVSASVDSSAARSRVGRPWR